MQEQQEHINDPKDRHPIITLGLLSAGTQIGSALIQRMGRHPLLLFAMGAGSGAYIYKHRKAILAEAQHLKQQSKDLISKKTESE